MTPAPADAAVARGLRLGRATHRRPAEPAVAVSNGAEHERIRIAALVPDDALAVVAMLGRCSATTRYHRFHGVTDGLWHAARVVADLPGQVAFGAWNEGRCVGVASMALDDDGSTHIGVLVEDSWQRRGAGAALVASLVARARSLGLRSVVADVLADDRFIVALLARIGPITTSFVSGGSTVRLSFDKEAPT